MRKIEPGRRIREFEIGMPASSVIRLLAPNPAFSKGKHWMSSPFTVVHRTVDSQCLVYTDLRVGLVVLIALIGEAKDSTSLGIQIGMTLRDALLLDETLHPADEPGLYTSFEQPGIYYEIEHVEPYIDGDFSQIPIGRIEVAKRQLLDEISLAEFNSKTLEDVRRRYLVL